MENFNSNSFPHTQFLVPAMTTLQSVEVPMKWEQRAALGMEKFFIVVISFRLIVCDDDTHWQRSRGSFWSTHRVKRRDLLLNLLEK